MSDSALPPLYHSWVDGFLPGPIPEETRSTCSDCAMCGEGSPIQFELKTKCCTYIPTIPNFLAGKILEQKIPVFEAYFGHANVRPQGVAPHEEFTKQYHPASPLFGKNLNWRCPYYLHEQGGLCGIWMHRNARCATWFCKHVRGEISREFWSSIETLFTSVEKSLAAWCIHKLGAGVPEFREMFPYPIMEVSFPIWMKQQSYYQSNPKTEWIWGDWLNRELEFFVECGKLVSTLSWKDVETICGARIHPLKDNVLNTYAQLQQINLPEKVRIGSFQQSDLDEQSVLIWNENPYDSIAIPRATLRMLHRMSGQPVKDVVIPNDLLLELVSRKILI